MEILYAALVLGGMGLLFGGVLTITSKVFAVPSNPMRDAIRELLPGANCGACGYPGCDGCADAMASGKAAANACPVCSAETAAQIAQVMGVEAANPAARQVARVICRGGNGHCREKFTYHGIADCLAASLVDGGNKSCKYACLGLGTCVRACKFDAIHVDAQTGIAVVDEEKCVACGKCIDVCPKHVLSLQPEKDPVRLMCHAEKAGFAVSDHCDRGCIDCGRCEEACKFGAIRMENHLPVIDMTKCRGCMMCAEACPTQAIWADWDQRKIAKIKKEDCIGCTICKRNCPFEAICGTVKQPHEITDVCTGCGLCAEKCPKKCIVMEVREHTRDRSKRVQPEIPSATETKPAKPVRTPEMEAKIQAALAAKAAREAAVQKEKKE